MKRKERVQGPPPEWLERLGDWELRWRRRVADWLQLRVVALPLRVVRGIFYLYVIFGAIFFTGVLMSPDDFGFGKVPDLPAVKWPAMMRTGKGLTRDDGAAFAHALDSIRANAALKRRLDSLVQARRGFADTMRRLEEYYK